MRGGEGIRTASLEGGFGGGVWMDGVNRLGSMDARAGRRGVYIHAV